MNKIIAYTCLLLAALTGTANAQPTDGAVPNPNLTSMAPEEACVAACRYLINDSSCHSRAELNSCVSEHPSCAGNRPRIVSAIAALFLEDNDCPTPPPAAAPTMRTTTRRTTVRTTTRPSTTVVAPTTPAPATDPTRLTYVLPTLPILGEGPAAVDGRSRLAQQTCEALGGEWYAEGRTADPSRARIVALIENLVIPNNGPGGGPDDDRNPGVCLTPEGVVFVGVMREMLLQMRTGHTEQALQIDDLRQQVEALGALRQELEDLRARVARNDLNANERDLLLNESIRAWARMYARESAQRRCRPGQATIEFIWDGVTEQVPCQTPEARRRSAAASDTATDSSARPRERQRVQIPQRDPNRRRLTGERLGFIAEGAFSMSRYQLVAHAGSNSPKFVGLGFGGLIRLADHLYLAGVIDLGVGLRDGVHVATQFEAHYRVGLLGVAAEHLLLGASFAAHHRYSGNGALMDQDGPWYQYRSRGLELEAGYVWRERGLSPFISLQLGLAQGQHADRRLMNGSPDGHFDRFDPYAGVRVGVMRLRGR